MNPILFSFGDFFIAWYGLLTLAGLLSGGAVALYLARRDGVPEVAVLDLLLMIVLGMIVGARGLYIVIEWRDFLRDPMALLLSRTGFVFLGGLIGAVGATGIYMWRNRLPFWRVADVFAPSIPLGHALGRVGCHMTGCCYGGVCSPDAFYAIQVPMTLDAQGHVVGGFALADQISAGLLPPGAELSLPIYPIQLFEAGALFLLAAGLFWMKAKRPGWTGRTFVAYLLAYPVIRFALEFFRGDANRGLYEFAGRSWSSSQLLGAGIFLLALAAWALGRKGLLPGQNAPLPDYSAEAEPAQEAPARRPEKKKPAQASANGSNGSKSGAKRSKKGPKKASRKG